MPFLKCENGFLHDNVFTTSTVIMMLDPHSRGMNAKSVVVSVLPMSTYIEILELSLVKFHPCIHGKGLVTITIHLSYICDTVIYHNRPVSTMWFGLIHQGRVSVFMTIKSPVPFHYCCTKIVFFP